MKKQPDKEKKELVGDNDLGIPYTTVVNRWIINATKSLLGIDKLNALYESMGDLEGEDFASGILQKLGTKVEIAEGALRNIPEEGAFVLISNYPHGALDGLLFIDTVIKKRPDTKFLGNFILSRTALLEKFFIEIDHAGVKKSNYSGTRKAIEHIRNGSPLIIFPAGDISTYYGIPSKLQDGAWNNSMMKFVRKLNVPVIPAFIEGKNSVKFHLVGKLNPVFRTLCIPLELLNKKGYTSKIEIGDALTSDILTPLRSIKEYSDFLRINVYCLRARLLSSDGDVKNSNDELDVISRGKLSVNDEELAKEISGFRAEFLFDIQGDIEVFYIPPEQMSTVPEAVKELLTIVHETREKSKKNEAEKEEMDFYGLLFVWDNRQNSMVAGIRIAEGDKLMQDIGVKAFRAYDDFEFSPKFNPILRQTIEMEVLFIAKEYTLHNSWALLRKGLHRFFEKKPDYRYIIGATIILEDYSPGSKWLIMNYLRKFFIDKKWSRCVVPRHSMSYIGKAYMDKKLLKSIPSFELMDRLIRDIDPAHDGMPFVLKEFLLAGGKILGIVQRQEATKPLVAWVLIDIKFSGREENNTQELPI